MYLGEFNYVLNMLHSRQNLAAQIYMGDYAHEAAFQQPHTHKILQHNTHGKWCARMGVSLCVFVWVYVSPYRNLYEL